MSPGRPSGKTSIPNFEKKPRKKREETAFLNFPKLDPLEDRLNPIPYQDRPHVDDLGTRLLWRGPETVGNSRHVRHMG